MVHGSRLGGVRCAVAQTTVAQTSGALALVVTLVLACADGNGGGGADTDGAVGGVSDGPVSAPLTAPECKTPYPALACDGDPHGRWTLAALCLNRFENCPGAVASSTGTATATITFEDGSPAYFDYMYEYDIETRLSVPVSCLGGASCESIGCFAGDNPCSCVVGSGSGGFVRMPWPPNLSGEVVTTYSSGGRMNTLRFCAGATTADSMIEGRRAVWNRICSEGDDCRAANLCHIGRAHCAAGAQTCEDSGAQRQVGTPCGTDRVCDAAGACIPCVAGGACTLTDQPCKSAVISCKTAAPVCVADKSLTDGTSCGTKRQCLAGVCKIDDGEPCTMESECRTSCTCGDAGCTTRFCGPSCLCRHAPPGGACAGVLTDGTLQSGQCKKACFRGQCLTEIGQICTTDTECGSGHCTCWNQSCAGGQLCSKVACPCQWASSGSDTCSGPLMDGLGDRTCLAPKTCVQGMCQ